MYLCLLIFSQQYLRRELGIRMTLKKFWEIKYFSTFIFDNQEVT